MIYKKLAFEFSGTIPLPVVGENYNGVVIKTEQEAFDRFADTVFQAVAQNLNEDAGMFRYRKNLQDSCPADVMIPEIAATYGFRRPEIPVLETSLEDIGGFLNKRIWTDKDGIEGRFVYKRKSLWFEPTEKGKNSEAYKKGLKLLGGEWLCDYTHSLEDLFSVCQNFGAVFAA